jgi:hypothetical protein
MSFQDTPKFKAGFADDADTTDETRSRRDMESAGIVDELRERLKLRYMGNCKCGHCSLVPDDLIIRTVNRLQHLQAELFVAKFTAPAERAEATARLYQVKLAQAEAEIAALTQDKRGAP